MRGKETTRIRRSSYTSVIPGPGTLIYADPPYKGTLGYGFEFDHENFWRTVARWSILGAHVFVSEYAGPNWADTVLEEPLRVQMKHASQGLKTATEKLFHVPPLTVD